MLTCYLLTVHSCSSQLSLEHNDEMMPDDVRAIKVAQAAQAKAVADRKADMEAKMAATLANPVTAEEKEQVREIITFIFTFHIFNTFNEPWDTYCVTVGSIRCSKQFLSPH